LDGKAIKLKVSAEEAARYGLGTDDGRVAELLHKGYWTLPDLVEGSGVPAQPVHALTYSFYITEALDIQAANAVPRLKRKAGDSVPPAPPQQPEASGAWKMPSGSFALPQPATTGGFTAPQPTTPKSILRPGAPIPPMAVT